MIVETSDLELWTDGSCYPNPGPGGWAFILVDVTSGEILGKNSGAMNGQTNNTMEMLAALAGLRSVREDLPVTVVTDSAYLANGFTQWLPIWMHHGWKTRDHKPVANQKIWEALSKRVAERESVGGTVSWRHVKGHAGIGLNEVVDHMAGEARKSLAVPLAEVVEV